MSRRILIIDDDDLVRVTLGHILAGSGSEIFTASDGKQGVDTFREFLPELVITDMTMPLVNGLEMIVIIKSRYPDVRIIAMSGGASIDRDDLLQKARKLGVNFTISKPFETRQLLSYVDQCFPRI